MKAVGHNDFNPLDILVLHNVNHRNKEKRLSDVAFMLNIEDNHTVNYALKKAAKIRIGHKPKNWQRNALYNHRRRTSCLRSLSRCAQGMSVVSGGINGSRL